MMNRFLSVFFALFIYAVAIKAGAQYLVIPPVNGYFCSGFIVEKCAHDRIDAFAKTDGGRLLSFPREVEHVDNIENGRCYIYTNRHLFRKDFFAFQINEGQRRMIGNPETVVFRCIER